MPEKKHDYVIVGGGLAGASAVEGIRQRDPEGSILLIGAEPDLPYHRPPLSKQLWWGKKKIKDIFIYDREFYADHRVSLALGVKVVKLSASTRALTDERRNRYRYRKLLLATGGSPRRLDVPGGDLPGLSYYRTLADYQRDRVMALPGKSALVIGGGFIGSEMATALCANGLKVTMLFPGDRLLRRVFPADLCLAVERLFRRKGIEILTGESPAAIEQHRGQFLTHTLHDRPIVSDMIVIGAGIAPSVALAQEAGLEVSDGIKVDDRLRSSDPNIYAAGDNASFPYASLSQEMRVEHWDNALHQGRLAGRNMAGADEPYDYMPFFFSDLFDFGYEAVGQIDSRLATFADWQEEYKTGVIYYLSNSHLRGVMLCNVWGQVETARQLIRKGEGMTPSVLRGTIRAPGLPEAA